MKNTFILFIISLFLACTHETSKEEATAFIKICKPICSKLGAEAFAYKKYANMFGKVSSYECWCFSNNEYKDPIMVLINKNKIKQLIIKEKFGKKVINGE